MWYYHVIVLVISCFYIIRKDMYNILVYHKIMLWYYKNTTFFITHHDILIHFFEYSVNARQYTFRNDHSTLRQFFDYGANTPLKLPCFITCKSVIPCFYDIFVKYNNNNKKVHCGITSTCGKTW